VVDSIDPPLTRARTANLTRKVVVRDGIPTERAAGRSCRIEIFTLKADVTRAERTPGLAIVDPRTKQRRGRNRLVDGFPMLAGMCSCE
jgi:hypothetical protein